MKAFIMAAGAGERWDADFPKELVFIAGEPVLWRTLRQLDERGIDAVVVTHKPEIQQLVPGRFTENKRAPFPDETIVETMFNTRELWEGRTIILLGDVLFSDETLSAILAEDAAVKVYGSRNPYEIFALTFTDHARVIKAAEEALAHGRAGFRCKMWEIYRILCGFSPHNRHAFDRVIWRVVSDSYSTDFDYVSRYEGFLEENPWARSIE